MNSAPYGSKTTEGKTPNVFYDAHVFINTTIELFWKPERDDEARETFNRLGIRTSDIQFQYATDRRWRALCSSNAYRKLYAAGAVSRETLQG